MRLVFFTCFGGDISAAFLFEIEDHNYLFAGIVNLRGVLKLDISIT